MSSETDTIYVDLPAINPFGTDPPSRSSANRARHDRGEIRGEVSDGDHRLGDEEGVIFLPTVNPFAAPTQPPERRAVGRTFPSRAGDRIVELDSFNPFAAPPEHSRRRRISPPTSRQDQVSDDDIQASADEGRDVTVLPSYNPFGALSPPSQRRSRFPPQLNESDDDSVPNRLRAHHSARDVDPIPPRRATRPRVPSEPSSPEVSLVESDDGSSVRRLSPQRANVSRPSPRAAESAPTSSIPQREIVIELPSYNPFPESHRSGGRRGATALNDSDDEQYPTILPSENPYGRRHLHVAQDDSAASDNDEQIVRLPSVNPFGPRPPRTSSSSSPSEGDQRDEKKGVYHQDNEGAVRIELPSVNPFAPASRAPRKTVRRASSGEDIASSGGIPSTIPFATHRPRAFSGDNGGEGVVELPSVNPFARTT